MLACTHVCVPCVIFLWKTTGPLAWLTSLEWCGSSSASLTLGSLRQEEDVRVAHFRALVLMAGNHRRDLAELLLSSSSAVIERRSRPGARFGLFHQRAALS
ncbi:hypothetical protein DPEC_G00162620 [Dallia pectoralis]|uniref:Uncharacterized protein n=1 Tax=Dallia pectoralis TaxID=75939 RepID=A0ACC2GGX2_DALPE|nr:hypothetical protein DPEC_G00162620 [Dallia pectoralis]